MKRVLLFLATNVAIVLVLSVTLRALGVEPYLTQQGLNLGSLLVFAAVFGMGGAFISLAISKWSAKRMTGAVPIETPATPIVMWFSRQREFRADAGGARLAGRRKMIAALEKLKLAQEQPQLPEKMAAFGISGGAGTGLKRLFLTHPPLDERIAALRRAAN